MATNEIDIYVMAKDEIGIYLRTASDEVYIKIRIPTNFKCKNLITHYTSNTYISYSY